MAKNKYYAVRKRKDTGNLSYLERMSETSDGLSGGGL